MKRMTFTGSSSGSTCENNTLAGYTYKLRGAGAWHILGIPGDTAWVDIKSLTVCTSGAKGAETPTDCQIQILDSAANQTGEVRWATTLRATKQYDGHFPNIGMIKINTGGLRIHTEKPGERTGVIVSCVYNCYTADEERRGGM